MKGLSLGDGQRLIVATVGLADPNNPQNRAHILASLKRQMSPVLFSQAIFFHLRGGIDYAVLSPTPPGHDGRHVFLPAEETGAAEVR